MWDRKSKYCVDFNQFLIQHHYLRRVNFNNVVLAGFWTKMLFCQNVTRKKATEKTFVLKMHALNVDEIDSWGKSKNWPEIKPP